MGKPPSSAAVATGSAGSCRSSIRSSSVRRVGTGLAFAREPAACDPAVPFGANPFFKAWFVSGVDTGVASSADPSWRSALKSRSIAFTRFRRKPYLSESPDTPSEDKCRTASPGLLNPGRARQALVTQRIL